MGPLVQNSPMAVTTSVILPTLARIAFFNSAALSSEAREREGKRRGREKEGGRGRGWKSGEGGRGEKQKEERG